MSKNFLTKSQLLSKLTNYNFDFTNDEFDELINLGYFHIFNSFVHKRDRNPNVRKKLSDYLNIYKSDLQLRDVLFTMILRIENFFKQRMNDTIKKELINNSELSSHYNNIVKYCIKPKSNKMVKSYFFGSTRHSNQIVNHYFDNHKDIPVWAHLELFDLGTFLNFLRETTDIGDEPEGINGIKENFSNESGFLTDLGGQFTTNQKALYITTSLRLIKDLRNNIAHNQPIIDMRFAANHKYGIGRIRDCIMDLSFKFNDQRNAIKKDKLDFKYITSVIALVYVVYIHSVGKDGYSSRLLSYMVEEINNNTRGINGKLHSNLFGPNYREIVSFVLSI